MRTKVMRVGRAPRPELEVSMRSILKKLSLSDKGATAIEYSLIAALIAAVAITKMGNVGSKVNSTFNKVNTSFK